MLPIVPLSKINLASRLALRPGNPRLLRVREATFLFILDAN
jgi:hypothetical protein